MNRIPKPYFYFLFTITFSLLFFVCLSFMKISFSFAGIEWKDSGLREFFLREKPTALLADTLVHKPDEKEDHRDSSAQRFLLIGDSMIEFFRLRFNDYCRHNGHKMFTVIWFSSQTYWFGTTDTLKFFIEKYKPTYVLLSLGANELFVPNIKSRQKYIEHILKQIGNIPFVWIGPPNWKEDTGINDLIVENVGPRRFFPSKNLTYTRAKDGAHPDKPSAFKWADSVAYFLHNHALHKVLMNKPDTFLYKSPPTEILAPKKN
ncbi:MAG: SGNH/GDSL hydrolase family protein [Bacteroidales bacterium]|nr:SGNH/GDSL hydrolase family protein [Bacteroidales bacterium]